MLTYGTRRTFLSFFFFFPGFNQNISTLGRIASAQKRLCVALVSLWSPDPNAGDSTSWWPEKASDPQTFISNDENAPLGTVDASVDFARLQKNWNSEDARVRKWHKVVVLWLQTWCCSGRKTTYDGLKHFIKVISMCSNVADWHICAIGLNKRILHLNNPAKSKYTSAAVKFTLFVYMLETERFGRVFSNFDHLNS